MAVFVAWLAQVEVARRDENCGLGNTTESASFPKVCRSSMIATSLVLCGEISADLR